MTSGSRPQQPTHYEILALTPSIIDTSHQDPATLIKKAYHRALLRNHPDKSSSQPRDVYTIDQITTAFTVLSSPRQRIEYDGALRTSQGLVGSAGSSTSGTGTRFQTGVQNVDLDDLPFDDKEQRWYRSCRCGNDKGYVFGESDLEEVEDDGVLMVGCQDCSLWLQELTDALTPKELA